MTAVELEAAYNVRDLGGLRTEDGRQTRYGLIYRGDSLAHITAADAAYLFGELRIGMIIDLRTKEETEGEDPRFPVPVYRFSLLEEGRLGREPFPSDDPGELAKVYLSNLDHGRVAVRATLEALARSLVREVPTLFHCAAGRDRTGVVAALLLSLVNVTDSEIAADYEASNRHARLVTRKLAANPLYSGHGARGREVILLKRETILDFLRLLRETFGGARQFALDGGVGAETISVIEQQFVSGASGAPDVAGATGSSPARRP